MPPMLTLTLDEADFAALDRHIAQRDIGETREAAAVELLRTGLRAPGGQHYDEGLRPDELNASNDS